MFLFSGIWAGVLCVLVAICGILYSYFIWIYQTFERRNIPYFKPTFPFGNLNLLNTDTPIFMDVFNTVRKAKEKGWNYFGIYFVSNPLFVPLDLDMVKCIMTKDFNNFVDRGLYFNENDDPISAHLFALGGQKWKNLRAKLTPTFTSGKMKGMYATLAQSYQFLEKTLEECSGSKPIDIKEVLGNYTLDCIGSIAFGIECNSFKTSDNAFKKYTGRMFKKPLSDQFADLLNESFPNLARTLHRKAVPSDVSQFFFDIVTKTINYRIKNNIKRGDFLQLLIDSKNDKGVDGKGLTTNEIVSQCFVFFLGGFETTANTMTYALFEISRYPEVQEKLREEIFRVLKKHENNISYEFTKDLTYLQQILDETLRKYPALSMITRVCVKDYKLPNTDVILKRGESILIPVRNIHYDETYYEDSEKFDPERFSTENKIKRHPYAHIPFGEGPRTCIGMRFALMQSKVTLSKILSKFNVTLNSKTITPLELDPQSLVPTSKGGIWLNFEKLSE